MIRDADRAVICLWWRARKLNTAEIARRLEILESDAYRVVNDMLDQDFLARSKNNLRLD